MSEEDSIQGYFGVLIRISSATGHGTLEKVPSFKFSLQEI